MSSQATSQNFPKLPTLAGDEPCILLSERQQAGMEMILAGATDTVVAAALGVSRRTIYSWRMENEDFAAELRRRRGEIYQNNVDRLRSMLGRSLDVLERQVEEKYAPTSHRAARTLLTITGLGKAVAEKTPQLKQVIAEIKSQPIESKQIEPVDSASLNPGKGTSSAAPAAAPVVAKTDLATAQVTGGTLSRLPRSTQKVLARAVDVVQALGWDGDAPALVKMKT